MLSTPEKKIKTQAQVWASKAQYVWDFFFIKAKYVGLIY